MAPCRHNAYVMLAAMAAAAMLAGSASATLIVPLDLERLAGAAEVVVAGVVADVTAVERDGAIVRRVSIELDEIWKGEIDSPLVLVERGGIVGDRGEIVYGAPAYEPGAAVVVFAARTRLGWQTFHLAQGVFVQEYRADGRRWLVRDLPAQVIVLPGEQSRWVAALPFDELRAIVTGGAVHATVAIDHTRHITAPFTTQPNNPRFFEADVGTPLTFVIDGRGDAILGLDTARRAIGDALAAWNTVGESALALVDGGLTNDLGAVPTAGVHRILFDDPNGEIFDPIDCQGTLGVGGSHFTTSETKTFGGRTYNRILAARVTFADNWDGCAVWTECNFAEIAAHEIGHAFGLGHSSESLFETDQTLRQALMYFQAHFDGRCADPREDDVAGVRAVYPAAAPPAIVNPSPLPPGTMGQSYRVDLVAANAVSPLTWASVGMGCPDFADLPGLSLSATGVISGTVPNFVDDRVELCFTIELTDAAGDRHVKRLDVEFVRAGATPTAIAATATPTTGASPTPTIPEDRPCIGDCNGDGQIGINELIRGVNIALANADLATCPSFDRDGNGRVSINELVTAVTAALHGCTS